MHFTLVKFCSEATRHMLDDVILPVYFALSRLGYTVECRTNDLNPESTNILFGSCLLHPDEMNKLPANSIIYNLEQLATASPLVRPSYKEQLSHFTVWDYSERNIAFMRETLGVHNAHFVPFGYIPEMTRLNSNFPRDIDVLFYGTMNERRQHILQSLRDKGLAVYAVDSLFGKKRDLALARAKLLLNIHYYTPATLEVIRLGYAWANYKAVVSECNSDTERYPQLEHAALFRPYEEVAETVHTLLRSPKSLNALGKAGFAAFSQLNMIKTIKQLVGEHTANTGGFTPMPATLNVGSGRDFRFDALNIDISPQCTPDLLLDISQPLEDRIYPTTRFGQIALKKGAFARIIAHDVLEHISDLTQTMSNLLDLLAEGGVLEISVPYDLSLGAWQDPTHVRTFNENSWLYYTTWAGYLGWRDERFELASMELELSKHGKTLQTAGATQEELMRTPRAVNSIDVTLVKRKSTPAEVEDHDLTYRGFYHNAIGPWEIN